MNDWSIEIAGKKYNIPSLAIALMLTAILAPAVKYALTLNEPTPDELLVAISISLFASVLFLWILDAVSLLPFREKWISKSVYGAAIVSILGTSVGVYSNNFGSASYPYEGEWMLSITKDDITEPFSEHSIIITYSKEAKIYWGYSNIKLPIKDGEVLWIEVFKFIPNSKEIDVRLRYPDSSIQRISHKLKTFSNKNGFI